VTQLPAKLAALESPSWPGMAPASFPTPVRDQLGQLGHLCQLCERELVTWGGGLDGLCGDCQALLEEEDHQQWVEAGGRTCRRCRADLLPCALVDGLCPCGGAPW
jgi:hypothetical protein